MLEAIGGLHEIFMLLSGFFMYYYEVSNYKKEQKNLLKDYIYYKHDDIIELDLEKML